MLSWIN